MPILKFPVAAPVAASEEAGADDAGAEDSGAEPRASGQATCIAHASRGANTFVSFFIFFLPPIKSRCKNKAVTRLVRAAYAVRIMVVFKKAYGRTDNKKSRPLNCQRREIFPWYHLVSFTHLAMSTSKVQRVTRILCHDNG
jgi:hypothetical protein